MIENASCFAEAAGHVHGFSQTASSLTGTHREKGTSLLKGMNHMKRSIHHGWLFTKDLALVTSDHRALSPERWETVEVPHTWNGTDGQDGGNDYYRGTGCYRKTFSRADLPDGDEVWLEFEGVNASADVYWNGRHAAHHDGGYSLFRANVTPYLQEENELLVLADNAVNDRVYPQFADFTFYGGLYRDAALIGVPSAHFALEPFGTPGVQITPTVDGENAQVTVQAAFSGLQGDEAFTVVLLDGEDVVAEQAVPASRGEVSLTIAHVHLWHGRKDPHLYTCRAALTRGEITLDERDIRFGCRSYVIDPERGFLLNGEAYPLRGVCRHQDRPGIGNALRPEHHREDVDLICEIGANTVRLAHYQHNQVFYDLCDERGLIVWAEIPYISQHMPNGRENTLSQMAELITQNFNHPSIVVWGLSNEITMRMKDPDDPDLLDNHRALNALAHRLDPTRPTVLAAVSMCPIDAEYLKIPDAVSYNLYFGWYGGDTSMNGPWLDRFHAAHPDIPIGLSEYGCEALNWHTSMPQCGDYTEEYQAHYHEELIKQLFTRPYLWATHVWNMFDFAADARDEGGCAGMNNKGLVTFDRRYRKDAFYAYKAWLSDEPFVHLCGKRYVERVESVTRVTVYSNQSEVELFANGVSLGRQASPEHFFYFDVPNAGETKLTARAGACEDRSRIVKVESFNMVYAMKERGDVLNWFEISAPEGHFSIREKLMLVSRSPEAAAVIGEALPGVRLEDVIKASWRISIQQALCANGCGQRETLLEINRKLNECPLPQHL